MKETLFVILVNSGLYEGGLTFTREQLNEVFEKWAAGEDMVDEEGEVFTVDKLIELGSMGEQVALVNESMVEMGDDFVNVSVCQLTFK